MRSEKREETKIRDGDILERGLPINRQLFANTQMGIASFYLQRQCNARELALMKCNNLTSGITNNPEGNHDRAALLIPHKQWETNRSISRIFDSIVREVRACDTSAVFISKNIDIVRRGGARRERDCHTHTDAD